MTSCTKEKLVVEAEKGTFILPHGDDDFVNDRCTAEYKCMQHGGILAPFTEKSEFDKVMSALFSCEHAGKYLLYPRKVGLIIARDNSSRIFSNGLPFDWNKHGSFYDENRGSSPKNCPYAVFSPLFQDKLQIDSGFACKEFNELYACFKPKFTKSDAISGEATKFDSNSVVAGISVLFVVAACLACFLFKQNKKLKVHQDTGTN